MPRELITESTIREAISSGKKKIEISREAMITPLAVDFAATKNVEIVRVDPKARPSPQYPSSPVVIRKPGQQGLSSKIVAFGSDHGGFQLKEALKQVAESLGYAVIDFGTLNEEACDYPDFAYAVAKAVSTGVAWRGVMIDGAGIGSCVVANKVSGVKAACCHNEFVARNAREHNDTNVLTLGSKATGTEVCKEILKVWLATEFAGGRHKLRVDKIDDVERQYLK